jgi:signal transduction histidine kinase
VGCTRRVTGHQLAANVVHGLRFREHAVDSDCRPLSPEARTLRLYRTLLLAGGSAYLAWWVFVRFALPSAFNPFSSRAAVVAGFFAVLAASYRWSSVRARLDGALGTCCALATAHYFYLFDRNDQDLNWVVGSYIMVTAVSAILQTSRTLLLYSLFVAALSIGVLLRKTSFSYVVFLPGMLTNLLFANVGLRGRLRLLDRLKERESALELANRELESFSYSIAHDLRSPLRAINGFSRLLHDDYADRLDAEGKTHLERIGAGAETMGRLIDALLGLARVRRTQLARETVDMTEEADAVITELRQRHPERTVDFVSQAAVVATGDPQLLRVLLDNLLGNAWKFTERQPSPRISFGCSVRDGVPTYSVKDNGAGFDMAYVGKLFVPFQRLHNVTEFSGTGIGLATVQRIVERHGGTVWAEGRVDQGASFYFTLEASQSQPSPRRSLS